jgi:non-ribosomal peptide synthase protein (TIGR01720 family)
MPEENRAYWESVNSKLNNAKSLHSENDENNSAEEYNYTFDKETSYKIINDVNKAYGTRANEVLLTAVGLAAGKLADGDVGIMVESYGRTELHKPIATERTIGWFTSCYPVAINNNDNITEELVNVKEIMRRIPKNGVEYLLIYEKFHKNTDILFNFYKTSTVGEEKDITFGGTSGFPGTININCFAVDDIVTVYISVPEGKHRPQIGEELGKEIMAQVERIIEACTKTDTVTKTSSDFSDDTLTQSELDELMDLFN